MASIFVAATAAALTRIVGGLVLLVIPVWFSFTTMVPFPQYRVSTIADFMPAIRTFLFGSSSLSALFTCQRLNQITLKNDLPVLN